MRKKTIKFYFSNHSQNYLFCFSTRSFRQNILLKKYKNNTRRFSKKTKKYKSLVFRKIKLNQWNINNDRLKIYFYKSFFSSIIFFRKSKKYERKTFLQLKLWYIFKTKFKNFLIKFIRNFINIGVFSSNVAHTLSRKNLSYQVWSKYRSKLFNMNLYNEWFYNEVKYHAAYSAILLNMIYSFSSDPRSRNIYYDTNFYINTNSNLLNTHIHVIAIKNFLISKHPITTVIGKTSLNFNNNDFLSFYSNHEVIEKFLMESDVKKREEFKQILSSKMNVQSIIIFSRFIIFSENNNDVQVNIFSVFYFIKYYILLYKYSNNYNLNNIDISSWIS